MYLSWNQHWSSLGLDLHGRNKHLSVRRIHDDPRQELLPDIRLDDLPTDKLGPVLGLHQLAGDKVLLAGLLVLEGLTGNEGPHAVELHGDPGHEHQAVLAALQPARDDLELTFRRKVLRHGLVLGEELLLAKNANARANFYSTLAGFVEPGESLEETVHREVFEEVGIKVKNLKYFSSQSWPFPNSLMLGFHAEYDSGDINLQDEEIADAQWFHYKEMPNKPAMVSISGWLIDHYIKQLEN